MSSNISLRVSLCASLLLVSFVSSAAAVAFTHHDIINPNKGAFPYDYVTQK